MLKDFDLAALAKPPQRARDDLDRLDDEPLNELAAEQGEAHNEKPERGDDQPKQCSKGCRQETHDREYASVGDPLSRYSAFVFRQIGPTELINFVLLAVFVAAVVLGLRAFFRR